jgi:transcriptional regulator with XRE-family HTH domain
MSAARRHERGRRVCPIPAGHGVVTGARNATVRIYLGATIVWTVQIRTEIMGAALKETRDCGDALGRHTLCSPLPGGEMNDPKVGCQTVQPEVHEALIGGVSRLAHAIEPYAEYFSSASAFSTSSRPVFPHAEYGADMANMTIGDRIAALRVEHRETQADLAAAVGCEAAMIGHVENGRRNLTARLLFAIAKHYCVSADFLWTGDPSGLDQPAAEIARALQHASPQTLDAVRAVLALTRQRE